MNINCKVYKSAKQPETYLFLPINKDHSELPDGLLALLGDISPFLRVDLHPQKQLAQAKAEDVISAIQTNGFYLQMPPKGQMRVEEHDDH